jgi:hypothetical protein
LESAAERGDPGTVRDRRRTREPRVADKQVQRVPLEGDLMGPVGAHDYAERARVNAAAGQRPAHREQRRPEDLARELAGAPGEAVRTEGVHGEGPVLGP